ncbi:peptidase S26B, signal peptidase [Alkaliphilus metalliredigens QYMF]|uniref:Signal peptidase I n=1 Tax=Alkaliphilus metalliredigens (strain QYMF) TaxID=293826 RepID=A6TKK1_ALKMQ|nr:signal peptidase I [Alkaliphilus metalliredigens]ABR46719.1 peptidase S26B, signal peptidase [Alkaliphilus metalliredigens QYMF]
MIIGGNFLPTQKSKEKCVLLVLLVIGIYVMENSSVVAYIGSNHLNYIIKPMIWMGITYTIWLFPRVKSKAKLKQRSFLNFWALNFAVIYIIVSVLAGIVDGLGRSPYSHTPMGILKNIGFVGGAIVGREFIRSYLVNNLTDKENYLVFTLVSILMTVTSISLSRFTNLSGHVDIVKFIAQYLAPGFAQNILATYLVFIGGPLTSIIYLGITQGFHWLSPILPNLKWITTALIGILCPVFCLMSMQGIYNGTTKKNRRKDEESSLSWMITSVISIGIIWFAVGVFPVYPSVIATGSMEPMIKPGDIILVKKIVDMEGIDNLKTGDIIQFKKGRILISHRITEVVEGNEGIAFSTKGDNNSSEDSDLVMPEQLKGRIVNVVPKIGWPTLLIKSKDEIPFEEIEF